VARLTFDRFHALTCREPAAHRARLFRALPADRPAEALATLAAEVATDPDALNGESRAAAGHPNASAANPRRGQTPKGGVESVVAVWLALRAGL